MLAVEFQAFSNYMPACLSPDLKESASEVKMVFIHQGTATRLCAEAVTDKPALVLAVFVTEPAACGEQD